LSATIVTSPLRSGPLGLPLSACIIVPASLRGCVGRHRM
jgi:hypothetical protein